MVAISHNLFLVFASIAISLLAAFTGLAITNNIACLPEYKRKTLVIMSSFILGGGIWSMHFVAMLAHEFAIPAYYDSLQTLGSALIAILVVGTALLMLHYSQRTPARLMTSGLVLGGGVIVMHYVGMYAIRGMIPQFNFVSVVLAVFVAALAGITAIRVAYGERTRQNIILGSVVFGFAVVAVHYAAMLGTTFLPDESFVPLPVVMANHTLALTVTIASFVICGTFLLVTTNFLTNVPSGRDKGLPADHTETLSGEFPGQVDREQVANNPQVSLPYEKNKKIHFVDSMDVAAARADGHYTQLYTKSGVLFCPWSISEVDNKMSEYGFHRTHRSYIVNIHAIDAFEKRGETGVCLFKDYSSLESVPVSRNRVIGLLQVLEISTGNTVSQTA